MKKIFSISVMAAFAVCMFTNINVNAQKVKFAGTVKFHTKYEGDTDPQKHVPHDQIYTLFGNKQKAAYADGQVLVITNNDALTTTFLYNIPGNKMGYIDTSEKYDPATATTKITITEGTDTKTICGYVCKRYDVKIYDEEEDEEVMVIVYTTTEIGENENINAMSVPGLSGFPLYTEVESDGVKRITEATEVKKGKIKAVDFLIPSDYTMYGSAEEIQQKIQELYGEE